MVNLSLSKLSEHSPFLSQNMTQKGVGMTAQESNSSSCVHNYITTMGDSHVRMHFIFLTGICCGTKISAPCFVLFFVPLVSFPCRQNSSLQKVSFTAMEICVFAGSSHAWKSRHFSFISDVWPCSKRKKDDLEQSMSWEDCLLNVNIYFQLISPTLSLPKTHNYLLQFSSQDPVFVGAAERVCVKAPPHPLADSSSFSSPSTQTGFAFWLLSGAWLQRCSCHECCLHQRHSAEAQGTGSGPAHIGHFSVCLTSDLNQQEEYVVVVLHL